MKPWMLSLSWPIHNYPTFLICQKYIQNCRQCPHGSGQQLKTLVAFLQTFLLHLGNIKMQASDDFCYFSHNCPFKETS